MRVLSCSPHAARAGDPLLSPSGESAAIPFREMPSLPLLLPCPHPVPPHFPLCRSWDNHPPATNDPWVQVRGMRATEGLECRVQVMRGRRAAEGEGRLLICRGRRVDGLVSSPHTWVHDTFMTWGRALITPATNPVIPCWPPSMYAGRPPGCRWSSTT